VKAFLEWQEMNSVPQAAFRNVFDETGTRFSSQLLVIGGVLKFHLGIKFAIGSAKVAFGAKKV
jgi:hypothetical protein